MVAFIGSFIAGARWLTRKLSEFGDRYLGYFGERYVAEWLDAGAQLQEATPFLEMILEDLLAVDRRGWPIQLRR